MSDVRITTTESDSVLIVRIEGDAGLAAEQEMTRRFNALAARRPAALVLDLSGMGFIASLGIGHIVGLHHTLRTHNGRMVIAGPNPDVRKALERTGIDRLIPIHPDVEAAGAALAGAAAG